jgi:MOSC domain-containing protein YiiM
MGFKFAPTFFKSRRVGYYMRVLEEGTVAAGDAARVVDSDPDFADGG